MTAKTYTLKVGDRVRLPRWGTTSYVDVKYVGEVWFVGESNKGAELTYFVDDDWQLFEPYVPQFGDIIKLPGWTATGRVLGVSDSRVFLRLHDDPEQEYLWDKNARWVLVESNPHRSYRVELRVPEKGDRYLFHDRVFEAEDRHRLASPVIVEELS